MLQKASIYLLNVYQGHLRIFLPCTCRFMPSCSEYTRQAIVRYGFLKGAYKGIKRILQCHPFSQRCGYDPLK